MISGKQHDRMVKKKPRGAGSYISLILPPVLTPRKMMTSCRVRGIVDELTENKYSLDVFFFFLFSSIVAAWTDRTTGPKRTRPLCPTRVVARTAAKAPRAPRHKHGKTDVYKSPSTRSRKSRDCCSRSSWSLLVARWGRRDDLYRVNQQNSNLLYS